MKKNPADKNLADENLADEIKKVVTLILMTMILIVPSWMIYGWVISLMWSWFIEPVFTSAPHLGMWQAIGVVAVVQTIRPTVRAPRGPREQADYDNVELSTWCWYVIGQVTWPLLSLGMAWVLGKVSGIL